MDEMLALLGDHPPCLLFKQLFLEGLPDDIRAQLVDAKMEDPKELTLYGQSGTGELVTMPYSRRPSQGQRKVTTSTTSSDQLCYYHCTFGDLARHCQHPCKWQGKVQVRSSTVALVTGLNDSLLFVWDKISCRQFLVNTGAEVSVLPATGLETCINPSGPSLMEASGS